MLQTECQMEKHWDQTVKNVGTLKASGASLDQKLASLYTKCLKGNKIPKSWKSYKMFLIHKKGDNNHLKNYKPISLLSNMYKVFTKIPTLRLKRILDENQAGFRSGYPTIDNIQTVNQLKEKFQNIKSRFSKHLLTMRNHLTV